MNQINGRLNERMIMNPINSKNLEFVLRVNKLGRDARECGFSGHSRRTLIGQLRSQFGNGGREVGCGRQR